MSRTPVGAAGAPDKFPLPETLEPSISQPGLVVANVYPVLNEDGSVATRPGPVGNENEPDWPSDGPKAGGVPIHDVKSHVEATDYAFSRFDPRAVGSDPELITYAVPITEERKVRDGWIANWTPKKAAALFAGTFVLFNAVGNAASIIADTTEAANSLLHRAKATISKMFGGEKQELVSKPVEVKQPGEIFTVEYTYNEAVGESTPEPEDIDQLINELKTHGTNGETVLDITIEGGTSDEWGPREGTLGKEDEGNKNLGIDRASTSALNSLMRQWRRVHLCHQRSRPLTKSIYLAKKPFLPSLAKLKHTTCACAVLWLSITKIQMRYLKACALCSINTLAVLAAYGLR